MSAPDPTSPVATPGALITAMLANCSDVIAVLDADTTIRYVNPVVEEMLGYPVDELIGRQALDIIHPADVDPVLASLALDPDDFDAGESLVLRLLQSDGEWREVEVAASNRIDQAEVQGIIVNVRDLTERRAQAEALRQQRDLVSSVIQAAATLVLVTDHEGK
ncbi:MAG: hypothetical protein QOG03_1335, partial [Actinomycetota bacterium]|nr:hypothetical protein [Actinomycetota bacterium]